MLKHSLACCTALLQLEAQPHSGLLSASWPAVCAVVEVTLCAVLHACTHQNHTHTHMLRATGAGGDADVEVFGRGGMQGGAACGLLYAERY